MSLRKVILASKPEGVPQIDHFSLVPDTLPELHGDMVHVEVLFLSLDPYMRGKISGRHMTAPIHPGDDMDGECVARVLESQHTDFAPGDVVIGMLGWREEAVVLGASLKKIETHNLSPSFALGVLGMPGLTAYAGALRLADLRRGMTAVVSSAAGPVGSSVAQLARMKGCRVVGIAGTDGKCAWLKDAAQLDHTINYKTEDLRDGLDRTCPDGIDYYFDNVGGDMLQAVMERLALGAQVVLCGLMSQYNDAGTPPGPNPAFIIKSRATVRGLVVYDHQEFAQEAAAEIASLIAADRFAVKEDVTTGLDKAPEAFVRLMSGETFGKTLVKIR
ncbi:MAG: NADP-dependent oxidoreductase [Pseudomonadota bacterium]